MLKYHLYKRQLRNRHGEVELYEQDTDRIASGWKRHSHNVTSSS
jgi:hypothetical protein